MAEDRDTWERARAGDSAARERIALLARECAAAEYARRNVESSLREDLAQECVRSTLAYLARDGTPPRELRAFLKYRAWGVLSDQRRRMRTALPSSVLENAPEAAAGELGPESRASRRQLVAALLDCRARLVDEQRETLALRYDARLEGDAIAERLGVHRNTVHVRVFRALAQLRECLARKGFAAEDLDP